MPELRLKEVRLPELHLPEMSREDIARAIGDARRDVDLARLDPRRIELPDRSDIDLPKFDLTRIDLSKVDVPKAIATATQAAGLIRMSRRPRLPFVLGGVVVIGLIGFAIATSPAVRPRLEDAAHRARQRLDAWRAGRSEDAVMDAPDVESPVAIPIEPTAFMDPAPVDPSTVADPIATDAPESAPA